MEKKQIEISFDVSFDDIRRMRFRTIDSPFKFTLTKRIYYVEYLGIEKALTIYDVKAHEVISFEYVTGYSKPFMLNDLPTLIKSSSYTVHIKAMVGMSATRSILEAKKQIANLFLTSTTVEDKKKLYRRLMVQYHPDKEGGSEEITKYINSFKTWK